MNNTTAILWYDNKDTLMEIQIFNSEEEARKFLKDSKFSIQYVKGFDSYPKIVSNLSVFVQEEGVLLKK